LVQKRAVVLNPTAIHSHMIDIAFGCIGTLIVITDPAIDA